MAPSRESLNNPESGVTTFTGEPNSVSSQAKSPTYHPISLKFADEDAGEDSKKPTKDFFTRWITTRIDMSVTQRRSAGFDDRVRAWRNQYEGVLRRKTSPWPGCSNLHIPITRSICDALIAHMYKTLFGIAPLFQGTYDAPQMEEDATLKAQAMEYICKEVVNLPAKADMTLQGAFIDGTAIQRVYWKSRIAKTRKWEVVTDELRAELSIQADATLARQLERVPNGEWRVIYREELVEDRADIADVDILDFVAYPVDAPDFDSMLGMWERQWKTDHQLWEGVKSGQYDYDAVEKLTATPSIGPYRHDNRAGGERYRYQAEGLRVGAVENEKDRPYEIFLGLVRYDIDGDGLAELVLVEVECATNTLLRAELYPYFHDRPFFVAFTPFRRKGFFYGYALPQIISDVQAEANALHNQYVDNNTLRNTPTFFYNRDAKWNPEKHPFSPGMAVAVTGDPEKAIRLMEFSQIDPKGYELVNFVIEMAKQVSAVSDTVLGQTTGGDATAKEIERALQSTNVKFDVICDRLRRSFEETVQQIAELYAQYAYPDMTFPIGMQNGVLQFKSISRRQMLTKMGFRLRGTSALSNPVVQAQRMEKLSMFATQTPMGQQFILPFPEKVHALAQEFIRDGAGIEDPQRFLASVAEFQQMQQQAASQPPPMPETKMSITLRADEVVTLDVLKKLGIVTDQSYLETAEVAGDAAVLLPAPAPGAKVQDATDDSAGYNRPERKQG